MSETEAEKIAERLRWKTALDGVTPETPQYARALELLGDSNLSAQQIWAQLGFGVIKSEQPQ